MKRITTMLTAISLLMSAPALAAELPGHIGTDISAIEAGTQPLSKNVTQYNDIFKKAGDQYGIDPNILAAICMQESGGINWQYNKNGDLMPAWGIMQIEYTNEKSFAAFGLDNTNVEWTLEDRLDPEKAVPYAAYLLSEALRKYDSDYAKMLQAYNFGETVLNRIIEAKGDEWMDERKNAVEYVSGWASESYGDKEYVEHVLRYYHYNMDYIGAKIRLDGELVRFDTQYPMIINDFTLVPIRAVTEALGAKVSWDGDNQLVTIKKGKTAIELCIGSDTALVNGDAVKIDAPAEVINNRTMVPLRFVAETFGLTVEWDGDTRTVEITT